MNFTENLRKLRKQQNMSQEDLADKLNVSRQSVSKWESGQAYPEMDKLLSICQLFNVKIDDLLNNDVTEVKASIEGKNRISKFTDNFLNLIKKITDIFLSLDTKGKIKLILEQIIIMFALYIIVTIGANIISNIFFSFRFITGDLRYVLSNIFEVIIFTLLGIVAVIVYSHIFKTRYLDYYKIVDKKEEKDEKEESNLKIKEETKTEKIIIRDPKDSTSSLMNALVEILLLFIKFIVFFMLFGTVLGIFTIGTIFAFAFTISKTGLLFTGLQIINISGIVFLSLLSYYFFIFIFDKKNKIKYGFLIILLSIVTSGIGTGMMISSLKDFKIVKVKPEKQIEKIIKFDRNRRYSVSNVFEVKYQEEQREDLRIVIDEPKIVKTYISEGVNNTHIYSDNGNALEVLREGFKYLNEKKALQYNGSVITIYTKKENIEYLKEHLHNYFDPDFFIDDIEEDE